MTQVTHYYILIYNRAYGNVTNAMAQNSGFSDARLSPPATFLEEE